MSDHEFDLVVIGSGPAGERGAVAAANLGAKVAMIEKGHAVGGAVANTGTLPSKTLRETALALSGIRARKLYGVDLSLRREATVADFMHHEHMVTEHERERVMRNIGDVKVQLFPGRASFIDAHTIRVTPTSEGKSESVLKTEKVLIATGSAPFRPPEFPFDHPRVHDSDDILTLQRLPRTLAVIGAGTIGSEYACTFAALGCEVHVIDGRDVLMPFLDREIAAALEAGMKRLGIQFHWQQQVTSCSAPPGEVQVKLELTSGAPVTVDQVLVAAGRSSNTQELNLEAAGITAGKRGLLTVNEHFQTSTPNIYAAGDVIGFPALASTGMEQARAAMCHAFDADYLKRGVSPLLPSGIYTIPEVSMVGETEQTAREKSIEYYVGRAHYRQNARGQIIGDETGFLKLLFRTNDLKLIGVHVIGEHATEVVHIGLMAMLMGCGAPIFNRACFNYPTLGDLYKEATYQMARTHLRGPDLKRVLQALDTSAPVN